MGPETGNKIFLVKEGVLRSYYLADGKDITAHFAMEFGLIGAVDSIIKGKKSRYFIEALENSKVYCLNNSELETYLDNHPKLERIARQISQALYMDLVERLEGLSFLTAKEKYKHLLNRYPNIDQRVNLGHIASYLGISQETLSRVRSNY
ncbi:MAG: Crp/Fnr family transcriptional regulator [Ekhidna sp.]|nr:Crp/Fnr family transcriptional regulator [Ekhidna sp.]